MSAYARELLRNTALALAAMALTLGGLLATSSSEWLEARLRAADLAEFERGDQIFMNRGLRLEFEDRLLLDELPAADYSRGGAYFIGSSTMKWGVKVWTLPAPVRSLVHNYAIGATLHSHQLEFVRFLVEQRGLLEAGGDKTLIELGLSYRSAWGYPGMDRYFAALWRRRGVYAYAPGVGPKEVERGDLDRRLVFERARLSSFIGCMSNRLGRKVALGLGLPLTAGFNLTDPKAIERLSAVYDIEDPESKLGGELAALRKLVIYIQDHGARVQLVLLPERAAARKRSTARYYRHFVEDLAAERGVPLLDLVDLLAEDEFMDYNHANARGLARLHPLVVQPAVRHAERLLR